MVYNVSRLLYNISILVDTKYKCVCVYFLETQNDVTRQCIYIARHII